MTDDDAAAGEPITSEDLESACLADLIAADGSAPTDWVASDFDPGEVAKSLEALVSKGYVEVTGAIATITPRGAAFYNAPSVVRVSLPGGKGDGAGR